jgi:hypothetical protein
MPMLQQQSAVVLPVQPKKSQNHMFWDVAPRTINPSQVCECRRQSDSLSILHAASQNKTGLDKDGTAAKQALCCQVGAVCQPAS